MDYLGVKTKLNPWLFNFFPDGYFLDLCSGTGSVALHAAKTGRKLIANDLMEYSRCILSGMLCMTNDCFNSFAVEALLEELNALTGIEDYFFNTYSEQAGRLYLTNENAKKVDACLAFIFNIKHQIVRDYLIWCLLDAVSKVSNTAGTYGAFLKKFKERATNKIQLIKQPFFECEAQVFSKDALTLLKELPEIPDVVYLDPPYNQRQYGANYHLYETLARNDKPSVLGVTGLRNWSKESKSSFCIKKEVLNYLAQILDLSRRSSIFLSYNTEGLLAEQDILTLGQELGFEVEIQRKLYRRYLSDTNRQNKTSDLYELLFCFKG